MAVPKGEGSKAAPAPPGAPTCLALPIGGCGSRDLDDRLPVTGDGWRVGRRLGVFGIMNIHGGLPFEAKGCRCRARGSRGHVPMRHGWNDAGSVLDQGGALLRLRCWRRPSARMGPDMSAPSGNGGVVYATAAAEFFTSSSFRKQNVMRPEQECHSTKIDESCGRDGTKRGMRSLLGQRPKGPSERCPKISAAGYGLGIPRNAPRLSCVLVAAGRENEGLLRLFRVLRWRRTRANRSRSLPGNLRESRTRGGGLGSAGNGKWRD